MFPPTDQIRAALATADDLDDLLPLMRNFYAGERLRFDEAVLRRALAELWRELQARRQDTASCAAGSASNIAVATRS